MKKILAFALVLGVLGVFAAGCSGGTPAEGEPKKDAPVAEGGEKAPE